MISELKFIQEAKENDVEVAAIKAVADVESGGQGFGKDGRPIICFEPHIFWQQLVARKIDPYKFAVMDRPGSAFKVKNPLYLDILYQKWGERPYLKTQAERYQQLDRASIIDRSAALASASWGKFQIMGFNYSACGCKTLQEFINKMWQGGEDAHLDLFMTYIKNENLLKFLRMKAWPNFAKLYNGPSYQKNNYDGRLKSAYAKYSK